MNKAALYCRLSKEDRDKLKKGDLSRSIQNQTTMLSTFALEKGFSIYDIYSDDDESGLYDDRPNFERLLTDARTGKFNTIIVKSQSRFTRNSEHVEKYVHNEFLELGIRFISIVDGIDTACIETKKSSQIHGLTDEWYCEDLSSFVKSANFTCMKEGKFIGNFTCYGYSKDPKNKYKRIIDETAASTIRLIFELYINGYGLEGICRYLEDQQIPTPYVYKKYHQNLTYNNGNRFNFSEMYNLWNKSTISKILRDETYLGHTIQHKSESISYKSKKRIKIPKENWIVVKNTHEPIIEEETFQKVQSLLNQKTKAKNSTKQQYGKKSPLIGKLFCKECGSHMINCGKNQKGCTLLRCQLARKSRQVHCQSSSILLDKIEEAICWKLKDMTENLLKNPIYQKQVENYLSKNHPLENLLYESIQREKKIKLKLHSSIESLKMLYIDRTNHSIDETVFQSLKKSFEESNQNYQKELLLIDKRKKSLMTGTNNKIETNLEEYHLFSSLHIEIVDYLIERIEIAKKEENGTQELFVYIR